MMRQMPFQQQFHPQVRDLKKSWAPRLLLPVAIATTHHCTLIPPLLRAFFSASLCPCYFSYAQCSAHIIEVAREIFFLLNYISWR
jgi:hypothetical protein